MRIAHAADEEAASASQSHAAPDDHTTEPLEINFDEARRFLEFLDPGATAFTFQTFVDDVRSRNRPKIFHGRFDDDLAETLELENRFGSGIFVTVNETDLKGRKAGNIVRVRHAFLDLDGAPLEPVLACALKPSLVVETSQGRFHCYWRLEGCALNEWPDLQVALALRFGGDHKCCDPPRVARLPGYVHRKGEPFRSRIVEVSGA